MQSQIFITKFLDYDIFGAEKFGATSIQYLGRQDLHWPNLTQMCNWDFVLDWEIERPAWLVPPIVGV